ncbi:Histone-lysine N-methyltransferase trithorax [Gryllus bimaculatus]|nr:Histone-lysine N-methyltransferase trithorax [Gryllus bimaculatus]
MGKFPGKPSKIVNRKRIKVSKCSSVREDDSVKAAETIYYGLAVFNETFGNEEQVTSEFNGFTRKEVQLAVTHARLHLRDTEAECKLNGFDIPLQRSFNEEFSQIKFKCSPPRRSSAKNKKQCFDGGGKRLRGREKRDDQPSPKKPLSKIRKKQCFDGGGSVDVKKKPLKKENERSDECLSSGKKFLGSNHSGNNTTLKNSAAKKLLQKAMKSCQVPLPNSDGCLQDKCLNGALRKFVLPSRSAHSSRVIKPNKRFIETDENLGDVNAAQTPSTVQLKRPKLILSPVRNSEESRSNQKSFSFSEDLSEKGERNTRLGCLNLDSVQGNISANTEEDSSSPPHEGALIVEGKRRWKPSYKVQLKLRELNVFGAGTSKFPFKRNLGSSTDASESVNSGSDRETVSQSISGHTTDKSESDLLVINTHSENKVGCNTRVPGSKLNTSSKVILKEARLKLNTQTSSLSDGPFSNSTHLGASLPETVECGVCGAVRFYRFVKQARKFGIFSCESCRKFISKMIKRQACAKTNNLPPLECHKGEGMCSVPPIVRSQQWKAGRGTLVRCSYKARCPACWLKMCLRSFKMPDTTRTGLMSMLPPEMQNGLTKTQTGAQCHTALSSEDLTSSILNRPFKLGFIDLPVAESNRLPKEWPTPVPVLFQRDPFGHQRNCNQKAKQKGSSSGKQRSRQKKSEKEQSANHNHKSHSQIQSAKLLKKASKNLTANKELNEQGSSKKKKKNGRAKPSHKEGSSQARRSGSVWSSHRQRIDLKGPRVKHVCRSASIVLGQIPATFPSDSPTTEPKNKQKSETAKPKTKSSCCSDCKENENISSKASILEKSSTGRSNCAVGEMFKTSVLALTDGKGDSSKKSIPDETTSIQEESGALSLPSQSYRKVGLKQPPMTRSLPIPGKRQNVETLNQVSIDFWESYDPEEVCNTGFGLIGSEPFHVRAICFLCGSGGHEQLIHCASCCEPYHRFCLEDGLRDPGEGWRYNWICQRCTVCHTCGRGQGQQLSCQRCHKTYHTECLGSSRLHSPDRPWVCPSCLRCKSCGAPDVTVFVGNLPLCKACFKLRQKGNYCPLCQRCYEDHDYDTKMMECAKCSCWVHAKCEGLSDEKYQVLSYLPESVEFICRMCCAMPPAPWWIAVEEELKAGYLSVLKSLSKNRKACAMLKSSPKKQCSCRTSMGKQLTFHDIAETKESPESGIKIECTEITMAGDTVANNEMDTPNETTVVAHDIENDCNKSMAAIADTLPASISDTALSSTMPTASEEAEYRSSSRECGELLMTKCSSVSNLSTTSEISGIHQDSSQVDISPSATELQVSDKNLLETPSKTCTVVDPALKLYWEKYNIRECSVRVEDILPRPSAKTLLPVKVEVPCNDLLQEGGFCESGKSPHKSLPASLSTPCSDSGISSTDEELKPCAGIESSKEMTVNTPLPELPAVNTEVGEAGYSSSNGEENPASESEGAVSEASNDVCIDKMCHCLEVTQSKPSLTLLSVKKKVNASEYSSLLQFHQEMESLISRSQAGELLETYHHTLQEVFPWFDPKYARVSSRPMHEDHFYCQSPSKLQSVDACDHSFNEENKVFNDFGKELLEDKVAKMLTGKDQNYFYSDVCVPDVRVCVLCKGIGDGPSTEEGRLLYCGQNEWAHTNCALWSAEVFEEIDGSLQNVHSAVSRGRMIRCPWCEKRGASVGCCARNCNETYHFPCARKAKCTFMDDKNVYCPTHARDAIGKILLLDSEFDVRRPIYVELDRKKKKFSQVQKVKFMIGSLLVENLGEFVSGASDNPDIIIPNGFRCSRYFWSSVEPWRIVQYQVKTIVNQQLPEQAEDLGWNVTIDHSDDQEVILQKLNEVAQWHRELTCSHGRKNICTVKWVNNEPEQLKAKDKALVPNANKNIPRRTEEDNVARQVVTYLLDTICSKDVDDSCLTDPQNTADILPPDLKDAIFEELPHDLLDGISMQDIFPKLMSYEDAMGIDIKSDGSCGSDGLKEGKDDLPEDVILATDVETIAMLTRGKKLDTSVMELGPHVESWFPCGEAKEQMQHLVEDLIPPLYMKTNAQKYSSRELKRSKF